MGKPEVTYPDWWMDDVEEHDYGAAQRFLTLKTGWVSASAIVGRLRDAPLVLDRPNDILRAFSLPALPMGDPGVHRDLMRLLTGKKLSPVLVADGMDIADGYHRVSLMYSIDPFMYMPLKIG